MGAKLAGVRRRLRGRIVPVAVLGTIAIAALVFRSELAAWFRGGGGGGAWSAPARVSVGALTIDASIQPSAPKVHGDRVRVALADPSGKPIDGADVRVTYDMPAMGQMPEMKSTFAAASRGGGRYDTPRFDLPMGGSWGLIVEVAKGASRATARYSLTVGTPGLQVLDDGGGEAAPVETVPAVSYAPAALDALRKVFDAYDRVRSGLSEERIDERAVQGLVAALDAAMGPISDGPTMAALDRARAAASQVRGDLTASRVAFADVSSALVGLAAADPALAATWRVFECPMGPGFKRWFQREPEPSNPYRGKAMAACVSPIEWKAAPAVAANRQDTIKIDEARRAQIGITTQKVIEGPMALEIRAVGRLTYDETRLTDVTLKVGGFVTDLRVNSTGQAVKKGQTLFTLYSPDLYAAQQEYLLSKNDQVAGLARAAEKKLRLWGLSAAQIAAIDAKGEPIENLPFASPASGYVIEKDVVEGDAVEPGMKLFRLAALDKIWVEADLYEADLPRVGNGTAAEVALSYAPGATQTGKVTFVYPYLDPMTRTGRVRIELPNHGAALKPDMYATVTFHVDLGDRVQVPTAAIVYTGPRRVVFVDEGGGRLRPQEITVGAASGDVTEVVTGLSAGDLVVTSGNFLVAAESRLRSSSNLWKDTP